MPCRKLARNPSRRPSLHRSANSFLAAPAALGLAGCGGKLVSFSAPDRQSTGDVTARNGANATPQRRGDDDTPGLPTKLLAKLLGVNTGEPKNDSGAADSKTRHIFCPEIILPEEAAASRVYAGTSPSNANLRYQFALSETARQCALEGDQLALKIGVGGKVLLGPAGSARSFTVPVRMTILGKADNEQVLAKVYHATVNIGQSATEAEFTIVSESLRVPFLHDHSEEDYTIKVGIGEDLVTVRQ